MIDEETTGGTEPLDPDQKKVDVDATATVSDADGPTHEVEVNASATVTDIREKKEPVEEKCIECGQTTYNNRCANADCTVAAAQASKGAVEPTQKAVAAAGTRQHVGLRGNVD